MMVAYLPVMLLSFVCHQNKKKKLIINTNQPNKPLFNTFYTDHTRKLGFKDIWRFKDILRTFKDNWDPSSCPIKV